MQGATVTLEFNGSEEEYEQFVAEIEEQYDVTVQDATTYP